MVWCADKSPAEWFPNEHQGQKTELGDPGRFPSPHFGHGGMAYEPVGINMLQENVRDKLQQNFAMEDDATSLGCKGGTGTFGQQVGNACGTSGAACHHRPTLRSASWETCRALWHAFDRQSHFIWQTGHLDHQQTDHLDHQVTDTIQRSLRPTHTLTT